jgi:3',5'-cyclic AMP phosphodiesterase CpdA
MIFSWCYERNNYWLHISDTHFSKPYHLGSEDISDSFFDDLKRMRDECDLYPDLIFFTGDVAFGQIGDSSGLSLKDQYEEAKEFIERI